MTPTARGATSRDVAIVRTKRLGIALANAPVAQQPRRREKTADAETTTATPNPTA